jgi:hypothetical protein
VLHLALRTGDNEVLKLRAANDLGEMLGIELAQMQFLAGDNRRNEPTATVKINLLLAAACGITLAASAIAQQNRFDALANSPTSENRPTAESAATLMDELLFQRASQTYLWALPLINTMGMKLGSEKVFGAGYNVLPIWKKRLDAKTLVIAGEFFGDGQAQRSFGSSFGNILKFAFELKNML